MITKRRPDVSGKVNVDFYIKILNLNKSTFSILIKGYSPSQFRSFFTDYINDKDI